MELGHFDKHSPTTRERISKLRPVYPIFEKGQGIPPPFFPLVTPCVDILRVNVKFQAFYFLWCKGVVSRERLNEGLSKAAR